MGIVTINAVLCLFSMCVLATYSQEDLACNNTVMVLTKEEMKREIRSQIAEALSVESASAI